MLEIEIKSWEHFQETVNKMLNEQFYPRWLFRGHEDSKFQLVSTLYRTCGDITYSEYSGLVNNKLSKLNAFNSDKYCIHKYTPKSPCPLELFGNANKNILFDNLKTFIYLRHHGFPSPLLDWTRSPYIAAYFAFSNYVMKSKEDRFKQDLKAAIHCLQFDGENAAWVGDVNVYSLGHEIPVHARHFLQQTEYTYAAGVEENNIYFSAQESANNNKEDATIKLLLPVKDLLNEFFINLYHMNINAYSLFGSEDSLVKSVYEEIFVNDICYRY